MNYVEINRIVNADIETLEGALRLCLGEGVPLGHRIVTAHLGRESKHTGRTGTTRYWKIRFAPPADWPKDEVDLYTSPDDATISVMPVSATRTELTIVGGGYDDVFHDWLGRVLHRLERYYPELMQTPMLALDSSPEPTEETQRLARGRPRLEETSSWPEKVRMVKEWRESVADGQSPEVAAQLRGQPLSTLKEWNRRLEELEPETEKTGKVGKT